jgi:monoamine oxidase
LPTATDALIGIASGNFAARLDRLADDEASKAFVDALKRTYSPAEIEPDTKPLVTNWSEQKHIRGAYSYTRYDGGNPDDPTALQARVEIGKPHAGGRILFAGEATCVEAYGTAHGAYRSGKRAAKQILNSCGLK